MGYSSGCQDEFGGFTDMSDCSLDQGVGITSEGEITMC